MYHYRFLFKKSGKQDLFRMAAKAEAVKKGKAKEDEPDHYVNWPVDANGKPLEDLLDKFVALKDFERLLNDVKTNLWTFFCWYPKKIDYHTKQAAQRPRLQHKLLDTLPYVQFARTERYPPSLVCINTTTGIYSEHMHKLRDLVRRTEYRYANCKTDEKMFEEGTAAVKEAETIIKGIERDLHPVRDQRPCSYNGVCSRTVFEAKHEWSDK